MKVTIESVTLAGFGTPEPVSGGAPDIINYDGTPLFCHVKPSSDGRGGVDVTFNEAGPDEFLASGPIRTVTVQYVNADLPEPVQTLTWASGLPPGAYNGGVTSPYLAFSPDQKRASLVLPNSQALRPAAAPAAAAAAPVAVPAAGDVPTLSLLIVSGALTGTGTRGYFLNLPLDPDSDYQAFTTARIVWPKVDGFSGPIGSVEIP